MDRFTAATDIPMRVFVVEATFLKNGIDEEGSPSAKYARPTLYIDAICILSFSGSLFAQSNGDVKDAAA